MRRKAARRLIGLPFFRRRALIVEPGAGKRPVAVGRGARDAKATGGVLHGQSSEEPQLHQARLDWVLHRQLGECLVQCEHVLRRRLGRGVDGVERISPPPATVLQPLLAPRVLDEDAPHGLGRGGEEMPTAVPIARGLTGQTQVCFVDQRSGAECLARLLLRQSPRGQAAQVVIDQRQKLAGGLRIAVLDGR